MKIIGHRGAAGLELENTLASLKRAKELGVDGIEFDVRMTLDHQLVLCHDEDLSRVSKSPAVIAQTTLEALKKISLNNGERIPTLEEALQAIGDTWAIVEVKPNDCVHELVAVLDMFPKATITVATFQHDLGKELQKLRPKIPVYLAEHFRPLEVFQFVQHAQAEGIDLNAWLLNPITYWQARRRGLEVMVYTVDSRFTAAFIKRLYPRVAICTNHPERFLRSK